MNLLKSIFITSYLMAAMVVAIYATLTLHAGGDWFAWGGVLLAVVPILALIGVLMMFKRHARTSAHFPALNLLAVLGVAASAWAWRAHGASVAAPLLAVAGWLGFLLYAYWYSTYGGRRPSAKLSVGRQLPDFRVRDVDGRWIDSAQLTERPAILIFFRGNWCPLCMAQVKELAGRYREIGALGVRVALISPQPHRNTIELARRFDVAFDFLTDEGNSAARILGIDNRHGLPAGMQVFGYDSDTVLPTVVITGAGGRILWAHETDNYRIRPEPDVYLGVLWSHGVGGS